jgi:hypothetical protein
VTDPLDNGEMVNHELKGLPKLGFMDTGWKSDRAELNFVSASGLISYPPSEELKRQPSFR